MKETNKIRRRGAEGVTLLLVLSCLASISRASTSLHSGNDLIKSITSDPSLEGQPFEGKVKLECKSPFQAPRVSRYLLTPLIWPLVLTDRFEELAEVPKGERFDAELGNLQLV